MSIIATPYFGFGRVKGKEREVPAGTEIVLHEYAPDEPGVHGNRTTLKVLDDNRVQIIESVIKNTASIIVIDSLRSQTVPTIHTAFEINKQDFRTDSDCSTRVWAIRWRE